MAQAPSRRSDVYFVGAGLSSAFGIPNTQQLLDAVHELSEDQHSWASTKRLGNRLDKAYEYLYPIETKRDRGFRPNVVDFFSVLKTYTEVSEGFPDRLEGTKDLQTDLQRALANVLINRIRAADSSLKDEQPELDRILSPGNLVVTSNWDLVLERYAFLHSIPVRHRLKEPAEEVTLLKLHGSVDWCLREDSSRNVVVSDYRTIRERLFGPRPYKIRPTKDDSVLRVTALENWSQGWLRIKSRSVEPLMITMAMGKATDLAILRPVWRDAYGAVSRARQLEIVGYSMPLDDIEIRTLLVGGLERSGPGNVQVVVRNPSPEVHDRFRAAVRRGFHSEYRPVASV